MDELLSGLVGRARASRDGGDCDAEVALDASLVAAARGGVHRRRALARVAGRMLAVRGWERLGFARLEDYAVERAGISGRELRDLAAVDRALGRLPALEAAYLAGRLGWTQLRLLCRVAAPAEQGRWLALAQQLGARELAREVRAVDDHCAAGALGTPQGEEEQRQGVVLRLTRRARARWWSARSLAAKVAGQSLSHASFAEVLAAELWSALPVAAEAPRAPESPGRSPGPPCRCPPAPELRPEFAPPELAALERALEDADAFELDARLRLGLGLERRAQARVASLLAEAVARGLHRAFGYRGLDDYAQGRLGLARSRMRALLRLGRAARECPELREAFASGCLSWVQANALLPLWRECPARAQRPGWIAHARRVSVRRLRDDVERALATGALAAPAPQRPDPAGVQTGAIAGSSSEGAVLFFSAAPEVAQLFRALLAAVQRRLERVERRPVRCSEALEAMLAHAMATWQGEHRHTPREWHVFERDGWRCTAPGCSSHRNLQRHHVVFRSQGGTDEPENLITLCAWHHLRGVHGGTLRCTGVAPDGLRFELGLRPGAPPLAVYASEVA